MTDNQGRVSPRAVEVFRNIEIGDKGNAEPVGVGHLTLINAVALGERLVPCCIVLRERGNGAGGHHAYRGYAYPGHLKPIAPSYIKVVKRSFFTPGHDVVAH